MTPDPTKERRVTPHASRPGLIYLSDCLCVGTLPKLELVVSGHLSRNQTWSRQRRDGRLLRPRNVRLNEITISRARLACRRKFFGRLH